MVSFSSKRLIDMGFKFKYSWEDMYRGAIETCRDKGLLPQKSADDHHVNGHDKDINFSFHTVPFINETKLET